MTIYSTHLRTGEVIQHEVGNISIEKMLNHFHERNKRVAHFVMMYNGKGIFYAPRSHQHAFRQQFVMVEIIERIPLSHDKPDAALVRLGPIPESLQSLVAADIGNNTYRYSSYVHDFVNVPGGFIDGGFNYLRIGGTPKLKTFSLASLTLQEE